VAPTFALDAAVHLEQTQLARLPHHVPMAGAAARDAERRGDAARDAAAEALGAHRGLLDLDGLRRTALGLPPLEPELDRRHGGGGTSVLAPPRRQPEPVVEPAALRVREDAV